MRGLRNDMLPPWDDCYPARVYRRSPLFPVVCRHALQAVTISFCEIRKSPETRKCYPCRKTFEIRSFPTILHRAARPGMRMAKPRGVHSCGVAGFRPSEKPAAGGRCCPPFRDGPPGKGPASIGCAGREDRRAGSTIVMMPGHLRKAVGGRTRNGAELIC